MAKANAAGGAVGHYDIGLLCLIRFGGFEEAHQDTPAAGGKVVEFVVVWQDDGEILVLDPKHFG